MDRVTLEGEGVRMQTGLRIGEGAKLYIADEDSGTIQLVDSDSQRVRLLNPPPPPPPTNTPTPTATLTPRPPVLTGLHDRASAIDI